MTRTTAELLQRLTDNPDVIGLIRYGSRRAGDDSPGGDFDLVAVVTRRPAPLESIHFLWGDVPVDLSIRTCKDFARDDPLSFVDASLADEQVLLDRTGGLPDLLASARQRWSRPPGPLSDREASLNRFFTQHALDKVRRRLTDDPVFCEMLLSINICWLLHTYYKVRGRGFPGELRALAELREGDPESSGLIERCFAERGLEAKLRISEELTERTLAPIGGPWSPGEILGLPLDDDCASSGQLARDAYSWLLGSPD